MGNPNVPKVLVMLNNKPLILHLLYEIEKINQLAKPVIVVGHMYRQVRDVLGEDYLYAVQDKQLGTAHALLAAKHKVKAENILVLNSDMPFLKAESLKQLLAMHFKTGSKISILTAQAPNFKGIYTSLEHTGRIIRDINHEIVCNVEHKDASDSQKKILEINSGVYVFDTKWLWPNLEKIDRANTQQEHYLTDILQIATSQGIKINSLLVDAKEVLGVNSREDLKLAESLLA